MKKTYIVQIGEKWYAFAGNAESGHVYGIGKDVPPKDSGCHSYVAGWSDRGIQYVASSMSSKKAAKAKAIREAEKMGIDFGGEV